MVDKKLDAPLYLARLSALLIRENNPGRAGTHPKYLEGSILRGSVEFERLIRDGNDPEKIESAILYVAFSPYWRTRVLCAYRFRRDFDKILKEMSALKGVR